MKELTNDERHEAVAVCRQVEDAKKGLCERDWPQYKHKKTGKIVKAMYARENLGHPAIHIVAVTKASNVGHNRKTPVMALNFKRDYERVDATTVAPPKKDALVRCMIVETGGQNFVCALTDWTEGGQSLGEFLRQTAGVLGDDYEDLGQVLNIHLDTRTQQQLDNLPEYSG